MKKRHGQFARGLALFNDGKFFEAHEAWEEIWLIESEPEKTFLQGLIQVAAAFHHAQRGNAPGMTSLLKAGLEKLSRFAVDHRGIAVRKLCEDSRRCAELVVSDKDIGAKQFPQIGYEVKDFETNSSAVAKRNRAPRSTSRPRAR